MGVVEVGVLAGLPWWLHQGIAVIAVSLWLALLATAAVLVRQRFTAREWSRKLVHIGTGAVVPLAWLLGIDRMIAVPAAAAVTLLAAINHRMRLLPAIEDVGRHSYGTVAYGAAITLLLLLFWPDQPDAVCAGVLVMALGDGLAGVLGAAIASPNWAVLGHRKSIAGTATMALVSTLALGVLALVMGLLPATMGISVPGNSTVVIIALLATALEQLAWLGIDNLTVPIVTGWLWASWR